MDLIEENFGTNWLNKLGVIVLVLGVAFYLAFQLRQVGPFGKVLAGLAVSGVMLGAGVFFETRDRYRILARSAIGGGWAMLFFTTYAMHHVDAARIIESQGLDLILLLAVAAGMVIHTLRYDSQVVTGLAFLLAFTTVAISHNTIYSLSAGAILAIGIATIALRKQWYQLEVFGLLASYLNHFFWLRTIIEPMGGVKRPFPEFIPSALLLVLYWAIFRWSYIRRKVDDTVQENTSTLAGVLNTLLLLGLMKYQAVHGGLAFYVLLILGIIEMGLAQLPATRRRRTAFVVLTTVGATLALSAVPFRYSGSNSSILWLAQAEAFLLVGLFTREKLFRQFGLLAGLLTGANLLRVSLILPAEPTLQLVLATAFASLVLYADAQIIPRRWKQEISGQLEELGFQALSYLAAALLFTAIWVTCDWANAPEWVAVGWATAGLLLAYTGRAARMDDLSIQAPLFAMAAFVFAVAVNRDATELFLGVTLRFVTFVLLAAILYISARWSGPADHAQSGTLSAGYTWAASFCMALAIYYEVAEMWVPVAWVLFAFLLNYLGRVIGRPELNWQAHALSAAVLVRVFGVNMESAAPYGRISVRLATVGAIIGVFYVLARLSDREDAEHKQITRAAYSWAGTLLVTFLIWHEMTRTYLWIAVAWALFGMALNFVGRATRRQELIWQAHALAMISLVRALAINLPADERVGMVSARLATVGALAVMFYVLAKWSDQEDSEHKELSRPAYSWAASTLVGLLMWYELQPINVALGWVIFGLLLFEIGAAQASLSLRAQGYLAFLFAFGRILFVNLNADGAPGALSPRLYTTLPLAVIFFYVYWRTQAQSADFPETEERIPIREVLCYFGTITIAALLRFELNLTWVVAGWAALSLVLLAVAWRLNLQVFLHQAYLVSGAAAFRTVFHNFFESAHTSPPWLESRAAAVGTAVTLLFFGLAFAFPLRKRLQAGTAESRMALLFARPEQWFFFLPLGLLTALLWLEVRSGLLTVAWGVLAVAVFIFAIWAGQRSFRLAGLALILTCIGKIVVVDVWKLEPGDRYLTFIGLGAAMLFISYLYTRYKETIHRYL